MKLEINKELVLSSAHVRQGELELLKDFNYSSDEYNVRLHVMFTLESFDYKYPTSNNLKRCLQIAQSLDCKWLVTDGDGPRVDFLETFEW